MTDQSEINEVTAGTLHALAHAYGDTSVNSEEPEQPAGEKFDFEEAFQTKIAAHALRDPVFMKMTGHLLKPEYFENIGQASMVNIAIEFYRKHDVLPDPAICVQIIKERAAKKLIKGELLDATKAAFKELYSTSFNIAGSEYLADKVAEFCRNQETAAALLQSVDFLSRGEFTKIEAAMKKALTVGVNIDGDEYDYFERITERTEKRLDRVAGKIKPTGVSTGFTRLDELLYHRGWGRKELSVILGGAKAGKTTALINFAKSAALSGKNVIYFTLEVASAIIADRLDASISDNEMRSLDKSIHDTKTKIQALNNHVGKLQLHEFPTGSLTPAMMRQVIERYKTKGIVFDLVVVDYADLMRPDYLTNDSIENSKNIYIGLRAIGQEEGFAVLTATQTNRDGFKSTVAKAEHVAEDFNKIRIADLVLSINSTEEEKADGEARIFFAASRNQEAGMTVFIKQDLARMQFIKSIIKVE